jgi:DNA-binding SARP family transcriptional activator
MSLVESARSHRTEPTEVRPEVEVAVLGPVEIRGAARPFCRSSAQELVVYLALHRHDVPNDVWATALWTDRSVAPSTLHSTASVARRALGRAAGGEDHLPRSGRRLRLGDSVGTDVERFARLAADPDPACWTEALGLVRGRPFEGLSRIDWAVLDGTQAEVESMVVDTALKGAEHSLRLGLGEQAEWMIRRGLRVSPYDERLYRALLWAVEVMGNRVRLRSTMAELLFVATDGGSAPPGGGSGTETEVAHSAIHPKTVALFRELARGESL